MISLRRTCYVALAFAAMAGPAQAQGFLQSLFGGGTGGHVRSLPAPHGARSHHRGRYAPYGGQQPWWRQGGAGRHSHRSRTRTYTAMCVRLCDGFYYPIASRTPRNKLYQLARTCEDSCHGNAKLFYTSASAPNIKYMTDLTGRSYDNLENAFLYRKKRVKACSCKPPPWSYQARAEHARHAAEAARKKREDAARAQAQRLAERRAQAANKDRARNTAHGATGPATIEGHDHSVTPNDDTGHREPVDRRIAALADPSETDSERGRAATGWPVVKQSKSARSHRTTRRFRRHRRKRRHAYRMRHPRRAVRMRRGQVRYIRPRGRVRR